MVAENRIVGNERIALEIHLRDQPLCEARSKDGIMNVRRPPAKSPAVRLCEGRFGCRQLRLPPRDTTSRNNLADKIAVIDGARRYTYRELHDRCVRLASALAGLGVGRLDTVAIIASNKQGEIGPDLFRAACKMGLEGLVSKRRDRPYSAGRSPYWVKVKNPKSSAMTRAKDIDWSR